MGGRGSSSGFDGVDQTIDDILGMGETEGKVEEINVDIFGNLYETEDMIRSLKHEVLVVFDGEGKAVKAYRGDATSVAFPVSEAETWKGYTVTHCHPKGAEGFGGTFSYADMRNATVYQFGSHRAVASGQGERNYILKPQQNADYMGLNRRIAKDIPHLDKEMKAAVKEIRQQFETGNSEYKSKKHAVHIARQKAVGVLNAYYRAVAKQYGFVYRTQK